MPFRRRLPCDRTCDAFGQPPAFFGHGRRTDGSGAYEGENEDTFDDTYNFRVQPDGVLIEVDISLGD